MGLPWNCSSCSRIFRYEFSTGAILMIIRSKWVSESRNSSFKDGSLKTKWYKVQLQYNNCNTIPTIKVMISVSGNICELKRSRSDIEMNGKSKIARPPMASRYDTTFIHLSSQHAHTFAAKFREDLWSEVVMTCYISKFQELALIYVVSFMLPAKFTILDQSLIRTSNIVLLSSVVLLDPEHMVLSVGMLLLLFKSAEIYIMSYLLQVYPQITKPQSINEVKLCINDLLDPITWKPVNGPLNFR